MFERLQKGLSQIRRKILDRKPDLEYLDQQDLSRFSEQDIVLESEKQIQKYLPEVLGQALARTWIDKRFLDAFYEYPVEVLERGGVYLPDSVSVEFKKPIGNGIITCLNMKQAKARGKKGKEAAKAVISVLSQ